MRANPIMAAIRREDKNPWERRVPVTPEDVRRFSAELPSQWLVEPAPNRVIPDDTYREAGARLTTDLTPARVIFGIKEVPLAKILPGKVYVFFSHVIKGQKHNMPMLKRLLDGGCTLIDYEKVANEQGRRLIFFGRHAGIAGIIDTLWAAGRRCRREGLSFAISSIRRALDYHGVEEAKAHFGEVGREIRSRGIPEPLRPFVIGFSGYGNVSRGAQEGLDPLPVIEVKPEDLGGIGPGTAGASDHLFKVVFQEQHMARPAAGDATGASPAPRPEGGRGFDLQDYYDHPERYEARFEEFLPHLTILVNCIFWEKRYPRLVTKAYLRHAFAPGNRSKLRVIGDISCDVDGAVECTVKNTTPGDPVFVYSPGSGAVVDGVEGDGVVVLAVDNLPAELPLDASMAFSHMLGPFVPAVLRVDYDAPFGALALPAEIKKAVIVHRGEFAPDYAYLRSHMV